MTAEKEFNHSTGNPIVDEIGKMNFSGNIIPESWYRTIKKPTGKADINAIIILADIVYWYRPSEHRSETSNAVTYTKKFHDECYLQRSYEQLGTKFGLTKRQVTDAVVRLEKLGLIKRHLRTVKTAVGACPNVLYLELCPEVLRKFTYPETNLTQDLEVSHFLEGGVPKKSGISHASPDEVSHSYEEYTPINRETNTETTQKNTSKKTTTMDAVAMKQVIVQAKQILAKYKLPERDIASILKAANYDIDKLQKATSVLAHSNNVKNVTGWLIEAITKEYSLPKKVNGFNNFQQRNYDYAQLERQMLEKSQVNKGPADSKLT
ncbi:hypothetical protein SAMN02910358_01734 [Lachnospiraceae bacterium XBB1006]|nr:hypothetical protein SAMN02910358_01734 [Lachnospiraceae bacterium XBB1006]